MHHAEATADHAFPECHPNTADDTPLWKGTPTDMREPRAKPVPAADVGPNKTGNQPRTKRGLRDVKDVKDVRSSFAPNRIDLESNDLPRIPFIWIRGSLE